MTNIPEGRRAWVPPAVRKEEEFPASPVVGLRARNAELVKVLREILSRFHEKGHPGEPCRRTGWIAESTIRTWSAVLEGNVRRSTELVRKVTEEQAKHVFANLTTCTCGYEPIDNEDWTGHRAAVAIEVVAAWVETRTSHRIAEPGTTKLAAGWAAEVIREGLKA